MLGIGAAWFEREHLALGVPYPPLGERFERLEETLQICRQMWSDDDGPYEGKHYQLAETICSPRPLQPPHPPILIGGGGEKKTLRLVAKYADACNLFADHRGACSTSSRCCDAHCETRAATTARSRRRSSVAATRSTMPTASSRNMEEYAKLGIDLVEIAPRVPDPLAMVTEIGEKIVPRLAQLG